MKETGRREAVLGILCAILSFALLYLVMLNRWGVHLWDKAIDYTHFGNWSDAISGLATTGAVIVALATLFWQRATQRAEEATRQVEAETAVFQWLTSKEVRDESDHFVGRIWDIKVQNSTVAPIYHWKIVFSNGTDHLCTALKRPLLPGENVFNVPILDNLEASRIPEPILIFQGRSGRFWARSAEGVVKTATQTDLQCAHVTTVSFQLLQ